jgi:AraC-like DNA-binding protein
MPTLSESLRTKLIPWSRFNLEQRVIVAAPRMRAADMPEGVTLSRRDIVGRRVIVRNERSYNNSRSFVAKWPEDHLDEVAHLKFVCVLSGCASFQLGKYAVQCGEGHFIFIPPLMPHPDSRHHNLPDAPRADECELLYFVFFPHAIHCWIDCCRRELKKPVTSDFALVTDDDVWHIGQVFAKKMFSNEDVSLQQGMNLMPIYFEMFLEELENGRYLHPGSVDQTQIQFPDSLSFEQQLRHYITSNIRKFISLEDAAREMYFSRAQFSRRVRQETGKTFVEILTECRLQEAKVLLHETKYTVNAIAELVGFKAPSSFRRVFQQQMGMTPGKFRETKEIPKKR